MSGFFFGYAVGVLVAAAASRWGGLAPDWFFFGMVGLLVLGTASWVAWGGDNA